MTYLKLRYIYLYFVSFAFGSCQVFCPSVLVLVLELRQFLCLHVLLKSFKCLLRQVTWERHSRTHSKRLHIFVYTRPVLCWVSPIRLRLRVHYFFSFFIFTFHFGLYSSLKSEQWKVRCRRSDYNIIYFFYIHEGKWKNEKEIVENTFIC